jgi:hypothetical protein
MMSIAVTARILPCKFFLRGMTVICHAVVFLGILYVLPVVRCSLPGVLRVALGCIVIVAACYGRRSLRAYHHVVWLQIDAAGGIRVADEETNTEHAVFPSIKARSVSLLPGSTLLPSVMLWQIRDETGLIQYLPIFPGSVSPEIFRALSLASRQIAGNPPFR